MQLTKLEIKGFKSFGDKVIVHFDKGITGIVGPNGCGKSNIVDAIRWVLGEQKTSALRSEKMENIIFNGTKNRKALQLAEVSLTFKNTKNLIPTEYNEVTITRRYYRSGESEYLLNDVNCRLKDITNLFLDTGIGSDSYAIIELKMVDNILNDKDNSRRTLFEEAAGVSKFKLRKKESLNKLKSTDKDLERVEDVLFEIDKSLKSLEKQAKQAESYHELKTQYKQFSVQLAKITLSKHQVKLETLKKKIETETSNKVESSSKIADLNAQIEKLKSELLEKEQLVSSRQKTLNEHVNKTRQYESDKKIKNERLRYLNERSGNLNDQLGTDKLATEHLHKELKALELQKIDLLKTLGDLENILKDLLAEQLTQKEKQNTLKNQLNEIVSLDRKAQDNFHQLKRSIEVSELQLKNLHEELEKTKNASNSFSENVLELESSQTQLADKINFKTKDLEATKKADTKINQELESLQTKINKSKEELVIVNRELDAKQNEFNLTKSLVENLEGFPEAIKFLKKSSSWNSSSPLLSDILTCPEEYRIAIENYLEPWMNYYVVDSLSVAYSAISLLKESVKGKANFFILDQIKPDLKDNESITNCKSAIEIIEFDAKYKTLIEHLLGNVYVLEHVNDNIPEGNEHIFLRKDGSLTKRKDSMTGGSVGLFEGKRIGRAKNLEKLEKEIGKLNDQKSKKQHEIEKLINDSNKLKDSSLKGTIEILNNELTKLNEEYISIKLKHEQYISFVSSNSSKKDDLNQNITILKEGIERSQPKLNIIQVELDSLSNELKEKEQLIEIQELKYLQVNNTYNQENIKTHQVRNKLEALERESVFKSENLDTTLQRISKNNVEIEKTDLEIKQIIDKSEISDDQLLALYEEKEAIEKGVNEAEKEYYANRNQIDTIEKETRNFNQNKDGIDNLLIELNGSLNEVKLATISIKERLSVEFKIDLNQLSFDNDEEEEKEVFSEQELNEKVLIFRNKIDKLGPINPMAMEAYNEIKERHDFIISQKEDLFQAKKSLLNTISEIDAVAKVNFEKAFADINANFLKVFRSLFTDEDTCNLTLTDPQNPLESDIDIIARPKGKKPLSINQLSGGEKTLTAVALLFAIYLIKPAPFCIFDEVDAPLDDANIDKFNNIIREFSKDSQFILVTHNKRTMSTTDIMYGVTMQESGVSKLVPVDLRNYEDENV